jgi:hypothetical protein
MDTERRYNATSGDAWPRVTYVFMHGHPDHAHLLGMISEAGGRWL